MKHPLHSILPRIRGTPYTHLPAQTIGDVAQPPARAARSMDGEARDAPSRRARLLKHEDIRVLLLAMLLAPFVLGICALLYAL